MLECSLLHTTSAETKLRLRATDLLTERKTVSVSWWSRPQAVHSIGVQEMFCRRWEGKCGP